jgi:hypothetical protein
VGDGAYGPGLTAGIMVSGPPPPGAHIGPAPPRAYEDRVFRNGLHRPGPPRGSGAATCGSQTPLGLSIRTGLGGPDLPFLQEGVRCHHVSPQAAREAAARPTLPHARGRKPPVGRQPNYRIK